MKTKICLMAALLLFTVQAVFSQSLDDAKKALYYEHYNTAQKSLQQIVSSKPSAEAYYYLGIADLALDNADAAKSDFQKGIKADPEGALNYVGLGRLAIVNKDYTAAKQSFQKAWDMTKGRDFNVVRAILQATALDPKADAHYALDLVTQFKGDRKNRKYEFTAADYTAIGNVYANLPNGGGKAATNYENAESTDAKFAKAFYEEGNLWDRARQDSLARQFWNNAIAADANYAPAYYRLYSYYRDQLYTYYRVKDLDKAKEYLNKYMALSDDKVNAQVNLVDVLYMEKNYQKAIDQANQLMGKVSPATQTRLYKLIAVSQLAMGDSLDAKKNMDIYFQKQDTAKILPFDYKTYADILGKLKQDSLQLVYLNKFVNSDTSTNIAFIRKEAYNLREAGNFKAADLWFNKLFAKADSNQLNMADYYYRAFSKYGAAVKGLGSYDSSIAQWKNFIAKYPKQSSGYYWLGLSQKQEDTAYQGTAIPAFKKYISMLKPDELKNKKDILEIIYSYMAGCAATKGDDDATMEYTGKLLEVNPHSTVASNIYANLAYKAAKVKAFDKATTLAQKSISINPQNVTAPKVLNYIKQMKEYEAKMKKYNEAKKNSGQ